MGKKNKKDVKALSVGKNEDFSQWFTEILQKAEIVDTRYDVKGHLVHRPWSAYVIEKMYRAFEKALQDKGHEPYIFPTVIPEENFKKESGHVKGFTPEAYWVTHGGDKELSEKLALRPTSETAFYQMFSLWIRGYKDLPLKTYQRANVFRYDTKATRPLLRDREFHWIETHCVFSSEEEALDQVREDIKTGEEVMHDIFGLPFMIFERPQWDKFPGASRSFAADVLNPDGKLVQQPSTHMISQDFSRAFNVKFNDKDGKEKLAWMTCYGPAMSRILASVIITHGDDKGLRFPWEIAPRHIAIVPINNDAKLVKKALELKKKLKDYEVVIDLSENKTPGEKFNYWELKGIPIRIDLGLKEIAEKKLSVYRRDLDRKESISDSDLLKYVEKVKKESSKNLMKEADGMFKGRVKDAKDLKGLKAIIEAGGIVACDFCSTEMDGEKCAGKLEKEFNAEVRGTILDAKDSKGKCIVCGKQGEEKVYIARAY
jgi:prolyl-tRNA synthetase